MAASMAQGGSERVPAAAAVALVANARAERAELDARRARRGGRVRGGVALCSAPENSCDS